MAENVNVTRSYKSVLPKVKGHYWQVYWSSVTNRYTGNVAIYLWSYGLLGDIKGSSYVEITTSDTFEQAQGLVRLGAEKALQEAKAKGVLGKVVAPDNVTGRKK